MLEANRLGDLLALVRWHGLRELEHVSHRTIILWVVVGMALLALVVVLVQRRRRRWLKF